MAKAATPKSVAAEVPAAAAPKARAPRKTAVAVGTTTLPAVVSTGATGRIVNAAGDIDGEAWGKAARWVDYSGMIDGKQVGVAILDHPTNLRHPTHWHARDYGLFAANPFGLHDFTKAAPGAGAHTIPSGGSLTFRHLVVLHEGDAEAADIEGRWQRWVDATTIDGKATP